MRKVFILILLIGICVDLLAQTPTCYRVYLHDKADSPYSITQPEEFLSPRAIAKRERFNIPITEQDFPINPNYLQALLVSENVQILSTSKWMNCAVVYSLHTNDFNTIAALPFVDSILPVANYNLSILGKKGEYIKELPAKKEKSLLTNDYDYGYSIEQIQIHNGQYLHQAGFQGDSMLIAILDAGWDGLPESQYFEDFVQSGRLLGTKDYVPGTTSVYNGSSHGTSVTSIIGLALEGELIGSAPRANFYFIRTENPLSEELIEEDFWVAGAEFADSIGADVINSSLGYTTFPDFPQAEFTQAHNDGVTSIASRAATIAGEKGIVVVISAGNDGNSEWIKLGRPADAINVLAVGACNKDSLIAEFSSRGYSADGRVKPDVCAVGWDTWCVLYYDNYGEWIGQNNGTSLSGPVIAGMAACLWQALPHKTSSEIMQIIRENGHLYNTPDSLMGYGIPDFFQAYLENRDSEDSTSIANYNRSNFSLFPNPCYQNFTLESFEDPITQVDLFDIRGRMISNTKVEGNQQQLTFDISSLPPGIYIVKAKSERKYGILKVIKK